MALNPFREALGQAGLDAFRHESSFKPEADAALGRFQAFRDDLERKVKRGDLTLKVAREAAAEAASHLRDGLLKQADGYSPVPRVFLDRLIAAGVARKRGRDQMSIEGLQRETNRLLRSTLIEQQLLNRSREFEGKTFVRSFTGGQPAPTLESLLTFHESAANGGDEAAQEWARRQLESMRARVTDPADQRRIDLACDRPDAVNPRVVAAYMESIQAAGYEHAEAFVSNALDVRDANACVAAFLLAREAPAGTSARWVRDVLNGLSDFPDAALNTLRAVEAEARGADAEAARSQAEYAIALAESQTRFDGVEAPTEADLALHDRVHAKPVARLGQPVGLALERRGFDPDSVDEQAGLGPADVTD